MDTSYKYQRTAEREGKLSQGLGLGYRNANAVVSIRLNGAVAVLYGCVIVYMIARYPVETT